MIKNTHKKILIGILVLAAVSAAGYFYYSYSFARLGTGTACTMEARQCPDGSFVGRTGPRCAFAPCGEVVLNSYFYSEARDTEQYGNILCSSKGLVAVPKKVVAEKYTITHALNELLRGEITTKQKADGLSTEFPLTGLSLVGVSVENGTAEILFMDPLHRSSGGSCRVSILRAQVEATVRQFPGINRVIIKPDEAFQP